MTIYNNYKVGVEIEFKGVRLREVERFMRSNLTDIEVRREGYNHRTQPYWKIVTDATVTENGYSDPIGGELVSPPMQGEDAFVQLRKVLFVLSQMDGLYVDYRCGVHVHLSWADMTIDHVKNVVTRYGNYEEKIDTFLPRSRRGDANRWCYNIKPNGRHGYPLSRIQAATHLRSLPAIASKYHKVSLAKIVEYGTVEFRQHAGSYDHVKIGNWIKFLMSFVEASKNPTQGASLTYKRKKKIAFGEIREQVAAQGWDLRFANNGYKLFDSNGDFVEKLTMEQLETFYVNCPTEWNKAYQTTELSDAFLAWFSTHFSVTPDSLFNGVEQDVQVFLNNRAAHLAA